MLNRLFFALSVWMMAILFYPVPARADWISLGGAEYANNIAEIYVEDDGVRVVLEAYFGDLEEFSDLIPTEWMTEDRAQGLSDADRIARFGKTGFAVRDQNGADLPVALRLVERRLRIDRRPATSQAASAAAKSAPGNSRLPAPPDDARVLYVELYYAFQDKRPTSLTFHPPTNAAGDLAVTISMRVYHREVPVIDFRFFAKSGKLLLDWDDPWYTRFENGNFTRHHRFPRVSYLYVDPYEIRHEALIRVRDAAELVGMELLGRWLTTDEAERLITLTAAEIGARTPISVDGAPVSLTYDRGAYLNIGMRGLVILTTEEPVNVDATTLGLVWSVPTDGYPQQAQLEWTIFNRNGMDVPAYAIDAAGPFMSRLRPDDPILIWNNYFKTYEVAVIAPVAYGKERTLDVPVLTILLIVSTLAAGIVLLRKQSIPGSVKVAVIGILIVATGVSTQFARVTIENPIAGTPDESSVTRIAGQLTENLHYALQEKIPERLANALGASISKAAFQDVKLELERALLIEMQGGGAGLVNGIRDFSVANVRSTSGTSGFQASVGWSVTAMGDHWGHPHLKNIRFNAVMDIARIDGAWKLTGMTVTSAQPEI